MISEEESDMPAAISINQTLPPEMLANILSKLDSKSIFTVHETCDLWQELVDNIIGVDLHLGRRNNRIWTKYNGQGFTTLDEIENYGVNRCFISRLQLSRNSEGFDRDWSEVKWKVPEKLRYLWIDGFISWNLFNRLILPLSGLRTLELHFTTLASVPSGYFPCYKMDGLVNLKTFVISMFSDTRLKVKSVTAGLMNGLLLLSSSNLFPQLVDLSLTFPLANNNNFSQNRLSPAICKFLGRHATTLQKFSVSYEPYTSIKFANASSIPPPLTSEELRELNLQLQSCDLSCVRQNHPSMTVFENLMNEQRHLKILKSVTKFATPEFAFRPIETCSQTLTIVQLCLKSGIRNHTGSVPYRPISLAPFGRCVNLEVLELVGELQHEYGPNGVIRDFSIPDVEHTTALPSSLRIIRLENLFILSKDCSNLVENKPSLEIFWIFGAGTGTSFGFLFETLHKILTERKLGNVDLFRSINKASVVAAAGSEDPRIYVPALMILHQNGTQFRGTYTIPNEAQEQDTFPTGERQNVVIQMTVPHSFLMNGQNYNFPFDPVNYDMTSDTEDEVDHNPNPNPNPGLFGFRAFRAP